MAQSLIEGWLGCSHQTSDLTFSAIRTSTSQDFLCMEFSMNFLRHFHNAHAQAYEYNGSVCTISLDLRINRHFQPISKYFRVIGQMLQCYLYFEMIYFRILKIFLSLDIFGRLFGRVTATRPPFGHISQCCRQRSWFYTYCLAKLLVVNALIYSFS